MKEDDWVIVRRAAGMVNAQIISGRLQTDGIPAQHFDENDLKWDEK